MTMKLMRMNSISIILGTVLFCAQMVSAANGIWTNGVVNKFWTNSLNWSASPFPSGTETATFTNSIAGKLQEIDLDGFIGCTNIVFDGANIAHYRIGTNSTLQTFNLISTNNASISLTGTVGSNQTFNSIVMLGTNAAAGTYTITNGASARTLTFLGAITNGVGGTAGTKTLNIYGTGPVVVTGGITKSGTLNVNVNSTSTLTLGGPSLFNTLTQGGSVGGTIAINTNATIAQLSLNAPNGIITIASGTTLTFNNGGGNNLIASQDATINGPGSIVLSDGGGGNYSDNYAANGKTLTVNAKLTGARGFEYYSGAATTGIIALTAENDYTLDNIFNQSGTLRFSMIRNKGVACNLGAGKLLRFGGAAGGIYQYVGAGDSTDRDIVIKNSGTLEHAGAGLLKYTGPIYQTTDALNATLAMAVGSIAVMEFSGPISNNHATAILGLTKSGTGVGILSGPAFHKGTTAVNAGTLVLSGTNGSILASSGITVAAGTTFRLLNQFTANCTNRVGDTIPITMNGGTFDFFNNDGNANYSETVGALTVNSGNSVLSTSRASVGKKSTLTLASLTQVAGTINFVGEGIGDDDRNRIFIAGQADGLIGSRATVNGTAYAAYSSTRGVYAADGTLSSDIAARGPTSTIPNGGGLKVRIATPGTDGPIELAQTTTAITSLLQGTDTAATVNTAGKTLQTWTVAIPAGKAAVTVGQNAGEGVLTANTGTDTLTLNNSSAAALRVNAVIADNGAPANLTKVGSGSVTLATTNSFTGDTTINEGSLVLANSDALQYSRLIRDGIVFDSSVSSHQFTLGNLTNGYSSGWYTLNLADNASVPVKLAVGKNNASSVYSGDISGLGILEKVGAGDLRITGDLHHTGGTVVSAGSLSAGTALSLGYGPVTNNATINLLTAGLTYEGFKNFLSGSGVVNVNALGAGTTTGILNGNYSAFTGVWNLGPNAAAGAGKVQMNGLDNAAATINVYTNATLYVAAAGMHYATINLHGGDTGESLGQLRLDNGIWAGPVNLKAATTNDADALIGGNGVGTISGVIDDAGAGILLDRAGSSTTVLTGANTYGGPTWVKQGTLQVPWCGNVSSLSSPLGKGGKIMLGRLGNGARLQYNGSSDDVSDRPIEMAGTTATAYLRHVGTNSWTLSGDITTPLAGNKELRLEGNVGTTGVLSGVISDNSSATNTLYKNEKGTWILSGNNTFKGAVTLNEGSLVIKHSNAFGVGPKIVTETPDAATTRYVALVFDGSSGDLTIPSDISFAVSGYGAIGGVYNLAGNNTIQGNVALVGGGGETSLNVASGKLTVSGAVYATLTARALRFWGDADGEISGVISNGATITGLPLWKESGSGSWLLSGNNTYTGATTVTTGKIVVGGANGRIDLGAGIVINGGTFVISNSVSAYQGDRVADGNRVTMSGGAFRYDHSSADEQTYSETVGVLALSGGYNTVAASQALTAWSSTLTFASLTRTGGTVDFVGEGLGDSTQNKIIFTTPPVADDALIGPWATVNGTYLAAYSTARGVYASALLATPTPIGMDAKGAVVTNDATAIVSITTEGTTGPDTLQGTTDNSVKVLKQDSEFESTLSMPAKTLKVTDIAIGADKTNLTIGAAVNEGLVMGLNPATYLNLINDSSNLLLINAGVTNNGTAAMGLNKLGTGTVTVAGRVSHTGKTVVDAGALELSSGVNQTLSGPVVNKGTLKLSGLAPQTTLSGTINNTGSIEVSGLTNTLSGVISGSGTITKSGDGQLTLSNANTYNGDLTISGGMVISGNDAALGSTNGETVITGGTLNFSAARNHGAERVKVQGAGLGGLGAIVNTVADSINAFRFVTLTGDTTFGGTFRWDIRAAGTPFTASLDMNGNTLTKTNINTISLRDVVVSNPGHVVVNQGLFRVEYDTPLGGTDANTFTVRSGATLDTWNHYWPLAWSVTLDENSILSAGSSQYVTQNIWNAGINLTGKAYLSAAGFQTFNGPITNNGSVVKIGASTTYFNNSANTYAGTTVISNGTLYAKYAGSLPGYDSAKVTIIPAAVLQIPVATNGSEFGWTSSQIGAISASTFVNTNSWVAIETFADFDHTSTFPQVPNTFGFRKLGAGMMTIPTSQTLLGTLYVQGGGIILNDVNWNTTQISSELGWNAGESARVILSGNTVLTSYLPAYNTGGPALVVGRSGRATLAMTDNVIVTNKLHVGGNANSAGAIYQSGNSTMFNWGGASNDGRIGMTGYGYYEFNSGTFTNIGYFQLGRDAAGIGILVQKGGAFSQGIAYGGNLALSRGGTGVIYTEGGTFRTMGQDANYALEIGDDSDNSTTGGTAIFTADENADVVVNGSVCLANRNNMTAVLNLNGGTFSASTMQRLNNRTGSSVFVNFDGGTFKSRVSGALFTTGVNAPTAVNIYDEGAIFDTVAYTNTIGVALVAPAGKGVSAIGITQGSGYIGPPMVTISGGGGTGATALALFDSSNGTVTGIKITSPGTGFTSTPTVTLSGGGCTNVAAAVTGVLLSDNVSGGLTKNGTGTLILSAVNTYTGPTVINAGILRLAATNAIPPDSDIVINGGVLDLNGSTLTTRGSVTVNAGAIINGKIIAESVTKATSSTALIGVAVDSLQPVTISEGTYKMAFTSPGLFEGKLAGAFNTTEDNPGTAVKLTTTMGNTQAGWGLNETYVYTGYIWNRAATNVTWTFAEHIDDSVLIKIDGMTVMNNGTWTTPTIATWTLTPGAHSFECRFGNGTGGGGPSTQAGTWFPANHTFGLGVDYSGRNETNIANYVSLTDAGNGNLFTTVQPPFSESTVLMLAGGATLDLNGTTQAVVAVLSGSGTVTNGSMVITGLVSPAGDAIGDLTFNCNLTVTGRIVLDVSASDNDSLIVQGNLDVSGAVLEVIDAATMPKQNYTIATAGGTLTGSPSGDFITWVNNPDEGNWKVKRDGNVIKLVYLGGTMILFY